MRVEWIAALLVVPASGVCAQSDSASRARVADSTRKHDNVHALAPVQVRARYQKRPSVYNFFEGEPSSRSDAVGVVTEWLDPLSLGDASALLRASPDLLATPGGGASLMGAPASANQVEIGGVRVPPGLVTGLLGGSITLSQWDVTTGGAAGATVNLYAVPSSRYRKSYVTLRSGAGGVPTWTGAAGQPTGVSVPMQLNASTTGPAGKLAYRMSAFLASDVTGLARWDRALGTDQRAVLDSVASALGTPSIRSSERNTRAGVIGRLDLDPYNDKHVLALTSALSRSSHSGGRRGGFITGSLGADAIEDVGLLQLESTNIVRERVMWTSLLSVSVTSDAMRRAAAAPTIIVTDTSLGNILFTGGAAPQATNSVFASEARSTGTWYSRDNNTRYVAQLQARLERGHVNVRGPHSTFVVSSVSALAAGNATSLERESGAAAASATSFVFAPAIAARHDIGRNASLLLGVRADAWSASNILRTGELRYVDVSPRASYLWRLGTRSANRGAIATLRVGAGRFTTWPSVQQWSDAWSGAGASVSRCAGAAVPAIDINSEAPPCLANEAIQNVGPTIAGPELRPEASNRADVSLAIAEVARGIRGEIGAAVAQNRRLAVRLSPLFDSPAVGRLAGEEGRALLVPAGVLGADGIVPTVPVPAGAPDATRLVSDAWSNAAQWRVGIATRDPFARTLWNLRYTLTTGRERSLAIASPVTGSGFTTAPLAAGGRHTIAFSVTEWIGAATLRFSGMARSGVRFTPLADRDLNGDGLLNDAAYVPQSEGGAWSSVVAPTARSCVRSAAGHIAPVNSCTGPWSVSSLLTVFIPSAGFGLPSSSQISVQISNPLALMASASGVSFGGVSPVNPTLVHVTGFDVASQRFTGQPLAGFGRPVGPSYGASDPVQFSVSLFIPIGPSVASQRASTALRSLRSDSSSRSRAAAAMEFVGDLPPIPLVLLQSGSALQLTAEQRRGLQELGTRWQAAATRIVLTAYDATAAGKAPGVGSRADVSARERLLRARADFIAAASGICDDARQILSPDQIDLLPDGMQRMLNPRFWKFLALQDAGEI